jgi:hypothetical protein
MVVRGKIRGNGAQLATYLLTKADNDNIYLFDIRGTAHPDDLRKSLLEMSLTSELTKSDKGLYHVQICPPYGEDRKMSREDWFRAAEILEEETGFTGQKRIIVMHDKNDRLHMHVAYERYDHEKGIMISDSFSRLAQDRARQRMEREFGQTRTPERNKNRPEMKKYLTDVWQQTKDAHSFMTAIAEKGYVIAAGTQRPYMVVDETGRSFDLVRQLANVKTKEVRDRFKETKLVKEKAAIRTVRQRQAAERMQKSQEDAIDKIMQHQEKAALKAEIAKANDNQKSKAVANDNKMQDDKERKKQEALDKLRRERLERARRFRENERDL